MRAIRQRVSDAWVEIKEWFEQDSADFEEVDTEYLKSGSVDYLYMSVKGEEELVRCDICAQQMELVDMPDMVIHVASHDEQGSAEIDPTEINTAAQPYDIKIADSLPVHELD